MSATISTSPGTVIAPAFSNRLFYTFTGHVPASEFKFRYVIDVEVNGTQVARLLKAPDPGSNDCTFNLSPLMRGQLRPDQEGEANLHVSSHPVGGTGKPFVLPDAGTEAIKVTVKVGRQYATTATGALITLANEDSEDIYLINGSLQLGNTGTVADAYYNTAATDTFLSNRARATFYWSKNPGLASSSVIIPTYGDAWYVLSFIHDDGTFASGHTAQKVAYVMTDATGTTSTDVIIINAGNGAALSSSTTASDKVVRFGAGPANIDGIGGGVITDPPGSTAGWQYYTITLLDGSNAPVSRPYVFVNRETAGGNIHYGCRYGRWQLFWANDKGGWDAHDGFDLVAVKDWAMDRKLWRRMPVEQQSGWEADHVNQGPLKVSSKVTIRSHYLQPGESRLLAYALRSTKVYLIELGSGTVTPVVLRAASWRQVLEYGTVMDTVTIECEVAYPEMVPTA
jgi:hypothetical protein